MIAVKNLPSHPHRLKKYSVIDMRHDAYYYVNSYISKENAIKKAAELNYGAWCESEDLCTDDN